MVVVQEVSCLGWLVLGVIQNPHDAGMKEHSRRALGMLHEDIRHLWAPGPLWPGRRAMIAPMSAINNLQRRNTTSLSVMDQNRLATHHYDLFLQCYMLGMLLGL